MRTFGPDDFELMLLRRMDDHQPGLVEDLLRRHGRTRADVREAHRRWQAMVRSASFPGGTARYRLVLGRPAASALRPAGDLRLEVTRWPVRMWPDLCFETIALPGGAVLQSWLARPEDAPAPRIAGLEGLRPWAAVVADVERAFPGAAHVCDGAPSRWASVLTVPGAGGPRRHRARFAWGLLQAVEPADP